MSVTGSNSPSDPNNARATSRNHADYTHETGNDSNVTGVAVPETTRTRLNGITTKEDRGWKPYQGSLKADQEAAMKDAMATFAKLGFADSDDVQVSHISEPRRRAESELTNVVYERQDAIDAESTNDHGDVSELTYEVSDALSAPPTNARQRSQHTGPTTPAYADPNAKTERHDYVELALKAMREGASAVRLTRHAIKDLFSDLQKDFDLGVPTDASPVVITDRKAQRDEPVQSLYFDNMRGKKAVVSIRDVHGKLTMTIQRQQLHNERTERKIAQKLAEKGITASLVEHRNDADRVLTFNGATNVRVANVTRHGIDLWAANHGR